MHESVEVFSRINSLTTDQIFCSDGSLYIDAATVDDWISPVKRDLQNTLCDAIRKAGKIDRCYVVGGLSQLGSLMNEV